VGNKGQWSIADQMQHVCAYHVIAVFTQLMHFLGVIQELFFVIAVAHSLQQSIVLKITLHFAKIVIGMGMMQHQGLLGINDRP
jgi:hypothetical protein